MQYSVNNTNIDLEKTKQEKAEEMLNKCIKICIEFCIEINEFEYLLDNIKPLFEVRGFLDLFLINLEPFILKHKIADKKIKKETILKIVDIYIKKNKLETLEKILTHLEINSINLDEIKIICDKNNFISAIIYIYMNGENNDKFYPIKKIFEIYKISEYIPKDKFINYQNAINSISKEELIKSKQYLGHKLFWYINLCIEGYTFPKNEKMSEEERNIIIKKIFLWIIKDKIMEELIKFDSYSYFLIITKILSEEKIIKSIEYDKELFNDIILKGNEINKSNIFIFLEIIVDKGLSFNKIYIKDDLYEFIYQISFIYENIDKEYILKACLHFLNYKKNIELSKNEEDLFEAHSKQFRSDNYIKNKCNEVIHMIDLYHTNYMNDNKKEDNLNELLNNCIDEEFIEIKLHLLKLLGKNIECFDTYLNNEKIEKREEKTFHFIQNTLKQYTDENSTEKVDNFKKEIIKRIKQLAKLSSESLIELINDWFENNHFLILEKLENSDEIKLIYVENLLNKYKNRANIIEEEKSNEFYLSLLNTHIDLLCKLKQYNKILSYLKNNQLYPVDYCLKKCLEYKVTDASIYLYQSTGNDQEALNLAISELKEILKKMLENSEKNEMEEEWNKLIEEHNKIITECINICENSGKTLENINEKEKKSNENEKMWFNILQIFYEYIDKINSMLTDKETIMTKKPNYQIYLNNLSHLISKDIEDLFEKMYPYTGIKKIISRVSEANKQASSREFKPVLQKLLKGYGYLDTILTIAKKLLANNTINNLNTERNLIKKGICYKKLSCDKCNKIFEENENQEKNEDKTDKILLFKCGHKIHKNCCFSKNNLLLCNICYENELNESISLLNFDNLINNLANSMSKKENMNTNEMNLLNKNSNVQNSSKRNKLKYDKLNEINKKSFRYVNFMEIDNDSIRKIIRK